MKAQVNLDWNAIRPLDGSQAKGFEELCTQLARAESPPGSRFERKGTPDAGVEAYAVLGDGTEWAWQAKYFDTLGDSQWGQLDESVRTAIERHPQLRRYYVCVPLDKPDARQPGRKSAADRWSDRVAKWSEWASERGQSVEFVYWGSSELLDRLAQPEHAGRVRFWFDIHRMDPVWFTVRLEDAIAAAGPRYTPEVHVGLPIAEEFDAFGRTLSFYDRLMLTVRRVRESLSSVQFTRSSSDGVALEDSESTFDRVEKLLEEMSAVAPVLAGETGLLRIAERLGAVQDAVGALLDTVRSRLEDCEERAPARGYGASVGPCAPLRRCRADVERLWSALRDTRDAFAHGATLADASLLILTGAGGRGKTHLVCDIAKRRLATGQPTVVLMGQRFMSTTDPWIQALEQLDMPGVSVDEFVGAFEAAAQAAGCRALFIIDAINEGAGRTIWPDNLAPFLARFERSPWIGVVLTVRSSYEHLLPAEVAERACRIEHPGFAEHEYDATRAYFIHYGLELPSTPLLAPEFRSPLFLKTLCVGLRTTGQRRLPRGFHGISTTFALYFDAINDRLARVLDYNPKQRLVARALEAVARDVVADHMAWLPLARAQALVDEHLPGRTFERSLYRGLVAEGVLVEESVDSGGGTMEEVVILAYERFADHLSATVVLDRYLSDPPQAAGSGFAPLDAIAADNDYLAPGLLEALCVQVPERTGHELFTLAPALLTHWHSPGAFRQSLVWRAATAFSEETLRLLNHFDVEHGGRNDTLEALLTVAMLPEHPYNANFLDRQLRRQSMPDRDVWWSTYLHQAWEQRGAVDRLIDWSGASPSVDRSAAPETDLCATALAWMFATSNRFVRDRATTALVALLARSIPAAIRLVERFADANDLYVLERVYAVAYGVSMQSTDAEQVGALAERVFEYVFAPESGPPAHILLRDYARGVIERALWLGASVNARPEQFRPPYRSTWPRIPDENEVKALVEVAADPSHDGGNPEWSRKHIEFSVMHDDFARYVIGTNTPNCPWLSLTLSEPPWRSPDERLSELVDQFSPNERVSWEAYVVADDCVRQLTPWTLLIDVEDGLDDEEASEQVADEAPASADLPARKLKVRLADEHVGESRALEAARKVLELAALDLQATLAEPHMRALNELLEEGARSHATSTSPPRLDLGLIQRYVLWRVFDLGWTTQRFGTFDRYAVGYTGRSPHKPERIGKKYQWIAYHEILALIADRFQYYGNEWDSEPRHRYDGPWQESLRDIDPSIVLRRLQEATGWGAHTPAWWASPQYTEWEAVEEGCAWCARTQDLPPIAPLLFPSQPNGSGEWFTLHGTYTWRQPVPSDRSSSELSKREIWYKLTAYFVAVEDQGLFMSWAETTDFWGRWMPEAPHLYGLFLGEYGWSPASTYFGVPPADGGRWTQPGKDCPIKLRVATAEYLRESSAFDCAVDESITLHLPPDDLISGLDLHWCGPGADFKNAEGRTVAFDPAAHEAGPGALLVLRSGLDQFLKREGLAVCWTLLGEKRVISSDPAQSEACSLRISGAYAYRGGAIHGFSTQKLQDHGQRTTVELPTLRFKYGLPERT